MLFSKTITRRFFYGNNISRKAGQKCCPYGQNGKPLSKEKVEEFMQQYKDQRVWKTNEDMTVLTREYYLKNIFCAVEFVKDLYEMDSLTTKQIPNVHILDQDIVKVELHTQKLKGLSYRDLELATIIDGFDLEKYKLVPIEDGFDTKRTIRKIKIDEQAKQFEEEIAATAGGNRFGNKFKTTDFEKNFK
ncbi:4a-hydroxytetrahydrobiopterin dehydratase [Stylonychia lemnae]|uniref:4a-hydroxytetrahydrobiopterin dehydratase n=1 Tax=Stylonychia lemnae TaxID=5949 RepID=A0A078AB98_STYLE|nr:4a-hydroxytetrahydrobiopterin dehydratase [Stylonychia lemnae]|eukprot:CDW79570.1 4a-hydroxytetrahydrobiopterin dehydratase [Stylonychia lemnae]